MALDSDSIQSLRQRFNLSYHIMLLWEAEKKVGIKGQRVLEVGGSLPRDLVLGEAGAVQWWGVEDFDYWNSLPLDGGGTRPREVPTRQLKDVEVASTLEDYGVFLGRIEDLPAGLHRQFSRVFSIACFEHIHRISLALEAMHAALEPGGLLFTVFCPIWSAYDGHHIPNITDASGKRWSFTNSPIPPWGHLIMSPPELEAYLQKKMDKKTAGELVYHVYNNPHINRYKTEDYVRFIKQSPFEIVDLVAVYPAEITPDIQAELERRHPGYKNFNNNGLAAVLRKA